jgi:phosphatidylglycerophosphate synthase/putative flippase GtrA
MEFLSSLLRGELSPNARIWSALLPAILLVAYFIGGLFVYFGRVALRGQHHDAEMASRPTTAILGPFVRHFFAWLMQPLFRAFRASGLPADAVTILSTLISMGAGVALAAGRFALGGWLYILSGALDFVDGRLARLTGTASPRGAALDSVLDRYADTAVLIGLAWYYRDSWVLLAVLGALAGSLLTSYVRARGEGLGVSMKEVGVAQRAERIAILGSTVALSPILPALYEPSNPRPEHGLAIVGITLLAVLGNLTAFSRLGALLDALSNRPTKARPGFFGLGRGSLLRGAVSAVVATGADFMVVVGLVGAGLTPAWATLFGCVAGGALNFALNRRWAFESSADARVPPQVGRYVTVSATSALLNAGGVSLLMLLPVDYRAAWWLARGIVFLAWNYPLQRSFVFAPELATPPRPAAHHA